MATTGIVEILVGEGKITRITVTVDDESLRPVTETHVFTGFGFSIDYLSGWLADTMDTVTIISELREDHQWVLDNPLKGHRVALDHREMPFMRQLGLTEDPTIDNLLTFNTEYGGWQEPLTVTQTVVFGVPALSVKTSKQNGNWTNALIGFLDDEAFLLFVIVPSEETLNNFLATWTRMLESIKPTK